MRPIIVTEFITLDGIVDSPGGGEHPHAGWTFKDVESDDAAYEIKAREMLAATALLFGRQTYDEFAPVWPTMEEFAEYNAMPKFVVSSTLRDPEWNNTSVLRSLDEVAALKETEGGEIHVQRQRHPRPGTGRRRTGRPLPPARLPAGARQREAAVRRGRQDQARAGRARGLLQRGHAPALRRRALTRAPGQLP